jgi:hypothetical protein
MVGRDSAHDGELGTADGTGAALDFRGATWLKSPPGSIETSQREPCIHLARNLDLPIDAVT